MNNNSEQITIASLNQYSYCPHRFWRIACAGEFQDNEYTIEGSSLHERVHTLSEENRGETYQIRAIWLKSDQYQLIGKADLIEFENGEIFPVEYKRGNKGEWDNDELQVCAQALCLEEMTGKPVNTGFIYYAQTHQRQEVKINLALRNQTINTISLIQSLLTNEVIPKAEYSKKCKGCSLYSACLPQVNKKVNSYQET